MSRATSATVYGTSRLDLGRMPATSRRAYGLRSAGSMDGYYPAYGRKPRRKRPAVVDGIEQPLAGPENEDAPRPKFTKGAAPSQDRTDWDALRHTAGTIRMADF